MADTQDVELQSLRLNEVQLLRELEILKIKERIQDLNCLIEESRLRTELKALEGKERARQLERSIEDVRMRDRLNPKPGISDSPGSHHDAPASTSGSTIPCQAPSGNCVGQGYQMKSLHKGPQHKQNIEETPCAVVDSEASLNGLPSHDVVAHASTVTPPPILAPDLTPTQTTPSFESDNSIQPQAISETCLPDADNIVGCLQTPAVPNAEHQSDPPQWQYYRELDFPDDKDNVEFSFLDWNLGDLYGYAETLEHNTENNTEQMEQLSRCLCFIFFRTNEVDDINKAIKKAEELLLVTHADGPTYAPRLKNLIVMLLKKYEKTQSPEDLNQAVLRAEEMATGTPVHHPDRFGRLGDLLMMRYRLSEHTGSREHIENGWETYEEFQRIKTNRDNIKAILQSFKTSCQTGDLDNIQAAVTKAEQAIDALPSSDPYRAFLLIRLIKFLLAAYKKTGNTDYLQRSIRRAEEALKWKHYNNEQRSIIFGSLSSCFGFRYTRVNDSGDIQTAIEVTEQALKLVAQDDPSNFILTVKLVSLLMRRYNRTRNPLDLQKASKLSKEGLKKMNYAYSYEEGKDDDDDIVMTFIRQSYRLDFGDFNDYNNFQIDADKLYEAMSIISASNYPTGINSRRLPQRLGDEPISLTNDFLQTVIDDLENNLELMSHDDSMRFPLSISLACCFLERYTTFSHNEDDIERALSLWTKAIESHDASPMSRITATQILIRMLMVGKCRWDEICRVAEIAVNILTTVAPRQLRTHDQQYILRQFFGLASIAASAALQVGKSASHAVQMLEMGRSVITGLRLGTRSEITELREQHEEIADRFEEVTDELNSLGSEVSEPTADAPLVLSSVTNRRHDAAAELDKIIDQIRHLPGFENFLQPPGVEELMTSASEGPVVVINVSKYRCDALLVETQGIRSIALPNLRQAEVEEKVRLMKSTSSESVISLGARDQMYGILEWLWDVVVRPILDELGFTEPPSGDNRPPRVWWIPTGPLTLLPLHAAGRPSLQSTESALDRVMSSYSPSIKALLYSRRNAKKSMDWATGKALLVSVASTPGYPGLAFADEEVNKLTEILPSSAQKVILRQPDRKEVLENLKSCKIFHFAGHGESHPSDPSSSSLLLRDGEKDPLTVDHLFGLDLRRTSPWLAYLSACSTGETRAEELYDEAINLVSACQLAGFQNVVGSLWEVSDRYSVDAAEEVYQTILSEGSFSGESIAFGVHKAIRRLRDTTRQLGGVRSGEDTVLGEEGLAESERGNRVARPINYEAPEEEKGDPRIWAAYIHVGP
ncbi:CHAT domain-containing protein [Xylaria grammica]|nr:CHAT domain-containing protein [Xylaria grammica]